jgi:hypothetical protein
MSIRSYLNYRNYLKAAMRVVEKGKGDGFGKSGLELGGREDGGPLRFTLGGLIVPVVSLVDIIYHQGVSVRTLKDHMLPAQLLGSRHALSLLRRQQRSEEIKAKHR